MFYIGSAYYPELWDKEEIKKDVERMKEYGLNCVRVGEFAWSTMEKDEGVYDFEIFKYMLDVMYENGIYTVLCTPTSTPPRWLFEKFPDAMRVHMNSHTKEQSNVRSRAHICKSHEGVRKLNKKIALEMAKALGSHKGVIGWQIDNEIYPNDYGCFCPRCQKKFQEYLEDKYKTIENLNKQWGMYRWSLNYKSFDKIDAPRPDTWENPSRQVEWIRFFNSMINTYIWEQAEEIRKYSDAPIGTDMMNIGNFLSYGEMNKNLDVVQHNHYETEEKLYGSLFFYDMCRPIKQRPFWVTETQPGWNGSLCACGGYRQGKSCYINSVAPIVKGGEMNLYWHFRSHPTGHELGHGAVFSSAGRPNSVAPSIKRASDDIQKCSELLAGSEVKAKIAMTYSSTATKNLTYAPIVENVNRDIRLCMIDRFYDAFRHYNIDVIETDKDLSEYEVILSPMLTTITDNGFDARVVEWVKNGGTWIVGPLSDIMTEYARKYTNAPYSVLEELCGVYTKYQIPVEQENFKAKWTQGGEEFDISLGCDAYECIDSECLATYSGFDLEGLCAIAKRRVGKGTVIILGTAPEKEALLKLVDRKPILEASRNISLTKREGKVNGIVALEIENKDGYIVLDREYYDILGERAISGRVEIEPYGALFLKEM